MVIHMIDRQVIALCCDDWTLP